MLSFLLQSKHIAQSLERYLTLVISQARQILRPLNRSRPTEPRSELTNDDDSDEDDFSDTNSSDDSFDVTSDDDDASTSEPTLTVDPPPTESSLSFRTIKGIVALYISTLNAGFMLADQSLTDALVQLLGTMKEGCEAVRRGEQHQMSRRGSDLQRQARAFEEAVRRRRAWVANVPSTSVDRCAELSFTRHRSISNQASDVLPRGDASGDDTELKRSHDTARRYTEAFPDELLVLLGSTRPSVSEQRRIQ